MAVDVAVYANSKRIARVIEGKCLLSYEKRSITIQARPTQFDVRRNQICAAELKSYLLKDACCLQFRAAISNALHRVAIQLARLNNPVRLQELNFDVFNLEWRAD